jgi:hypothetical protein
LTQLQHIGTAAAVLIAEVALNENGKERAVHLQSLTFLAELAEQTSSIYLSAETVSNTLRDILKVGYTGYDAMRVSPDLPVQKKRNNEEQSEPLRGRTHRQSTPSTVPGVEVTCRVLPNPSTNTDGMSASSNSQFTHNRLPLPEEAVFDARAPLEESSGSASMEFDWDLPTLGMIENPHLANNELFFSDLTPALAI